MLCELRTHGHVLLATRRRLLFYQGRACKPNFSFGDNKALSYHGPDKKSLSPSNHISFTASKTIKNTASLVGGFRDLRWLDWIFWELSVYSVSINKDIGKRLPQLYYIKMKNSYDPCFVDFGVTMVT